MTPKEAIEKLLSRKWTVDQIADASSMHRATVYRILSGEIPSYKNALSLLEIAKGRPVPPKETKS